MRGKRNPHTLLVQLLWKAVWKFLKKVHIKLPFDLVMPLLALNPKECKSGYNRDTCTPMFIVAPFITANLWNQHRCPLTDKWIKKL
jgi:hypothetical protein